jgi:O-antigen/teichoic acid export membrane protein
MQASNRAELKAKAARGSLMLTSAMLIQRPLNMVGMVIIARLLDPSHFGMVAMAMLLMTSSYLVVDLGMGPALIQTGVDHNKVTFPALAVTLVCGALLWLLVYVFAAPLAAWLGNGEVAPVIRTLSALIGLEALVTIPDALLRKELRFGRVSLLSLSMELTNTLVTVLLALAGFGVWSLVYGRLVAATLKTVLAWLFCPGWEWLNPAHWEWRRTIEMMRYGISTTAGGLVAYFHGNWDDWLVGRIFGSGALGFYRQAYDLSNGTLASLSRGVINGVFFPSYTRILDDRARLTRIYIKSLRFVLLLMTPMALGLFVVAPELVRVVLGAKWTPMITTLQIYALLVLTRPLSSNTYPLFQAMGHPEYNLHAGLVLVAVMVPLAMLLLPYQIEGVALAVVLAHTAGALYNIYQANTLLPGTFGATVNAVKAPLAMGVVMAASVFFSKAWVAHLTGSVANWWGLGLLVLIGVAIYSAGALLLQGDLVREVTNMMIGSLGLKKRLLRAPA